MDVRTLEALLAEARKWAGQVPALDAEVCVGQERLQQLHIEMQAARNAAVIEVWMRINMIASPYIIYILLCCRLQEHLEHYEGMQAQQDAHEDNVAASEAVNNEGEAEGQCVVCMDAEMTQLLYPCGHQCVCLACVQILEAGTKECPVCRAEFSLFCNVYRC